LKEVLVEFFSNIWIDLDWRSWPLNWFAICNAEASQFFSSLNAK
jgi:hypothetical protein